MTTDDIATAPGQATPAKVVRLFPTHVLSEVWTKARQQGPALGEAISERRAAQPLSPTSPLGWHSDNDMVNWGGPAARELLDHVSRRVNGTVHDVLQQGNRIRFNWSVEMWAEVTDKLGSIQVHSHPGAYLTAIYYVDDGYGGSDDPALGGELVLIDPRYPMVRMHTPDLRARLGEGRIDQHEVRLRPTTGQLLIFPSWLAHGVLPFHGSAPRVAIGINFAARYTA